MNYIKLDGDVDIKHEKDEGEYPYFTKYLKSIIL